MPHLPVLKSYGLMVPGTLLASQCVAEDITLFPRPEPGRCHGCRRGIYGIGGRPPVKVEQLQLEKSQ